MDFVYRTPINLVLYSVGEFQRVFIPKRDRKLSRTKKVLYFVKVMVFWLSKPDISQAVNTNYEYPISFQPYRLSTFMVFQMVETLTLHERFVNLKTKKMSYMDNEAYISLMGFAYASARWRRRIT